MKSVTEMSDPRDLSSARSLSRSVMSTATVTVKVGTDVPSVSRRAMVWRMRLSVSPAPDMAAAGSAGADAGRRDAAAAAERGGGLARAGAAAGADAAAAEAAARTSRSTMRPPGPVPVTLRGSMPSSAATRLARGLMMIRPPADCGSPATAAGRPGDRPAPPDAAG